MSVVRSRRTRLPRALRALLWAAPLILGSCGGDDTSPPGTPVITMGSETSNPDPDFASYGVSIDSMTLTRNDGTVVEPIVTPETVDLNKLTSLSELVEAPAEQELSEKWSRCARRERRCGLSPLLWPPRATG